MSKKYFVFLSFLELFVILSPENVIVGKMTENNLTKLISIVIAVMISVMFTACSDDDAMSYDQQRAAEVKQALLGIQVDMSDIAMGGDDIALWQLNEDGTFDMVFLSMIEGSILNEEKDSFDIDVFQGTWEPIVDVENPWDSSAEKQSGFKATFHLGEEASNGENISVTYYVERVEDEEGEPVLVMLDEVAIEYMMMMEYDGDDEPATRAFTDNVFDRKKKKLANMSSVVRKKFGSTFKDLHTSDKNEGLWAKEYKIYWQEAQDALKTMRADFNVSSTNYAEWMTEIYTNKGKNPRICDMNIPGSHDTFTAYLYWPSILRLELGWTWATTQRRYIDTQWEYGARVFDFRLRYTEAKDSKPEHMDLYHTFFLYIDFDTALKEIFTQLEKHPGETAIAALAFDDDGTDNHLRVTNQTLKKYADQGKIVINPAPDVRLKDCAGKLIILYSHEFGSKRSELYGPMLFVGRNNQYSKSMLSFRVNGQDQNVSITYQNLYEMAGKSGTEDNERFWERKKANFEMCFWDFQKYRSREDVVWSWNQVNAYIGNYLTMSYSQNAEVMNPWVANFALQHKESPMGIITMDYLGYNAKYFNHYCNGEDLPKIIVETNRYQ